jgi:transposase
MTMIEQIEKQIKIDKIINWYENEIELLLNDIKELETKTKEKRSSRECWSYYECYC